MACPYPIKEVTEEADSSMFEVMADLTWGVSRDEREIVLILDKEGV